MSNRTIEFRGTPRTIVGSPLKVGDKFPNATLQANDWSEVDLASFDGVVRLVSVVPSLDSGVCDAQTKRFNEEAEKLGEMVKVITISADSPFTQKRWATDAEVKNITVLSDHMNLSFGDAVGAHIQDLRLDQRSVFVVDSDGTLRYVEYVPIFGQHPDYDAAIEATQKLIQKVQSPK
jgi:thiol peroxidase